MSVLASIRSQLAPIHRGGRPFIGIFALASLFLFWLWSPLGWLGTMATIWCVYFFRDPGRVTPIREGIVVSPADGRVSRVVNAVPPKELGLGERSMARVSIFMSVFDCHVNRSPVTGKIERIVYHHGAFMSADLDKASDTAGGRIGMIRFGSRVDVYLPDSVRPLVAEGQTAIAGETVIADLRAGDPQRSFRVG